MLGQCKPELANSSGKVPRIAETSKTIQNSQDLSACAIDSEPRLTFGVFLLEDITWIVLYLLYI